MKIYLHELTQSMDWGMKWQIYIDRRDLLIDYMEAQRTLSAGRNYVNTEGCTDWKGDQIRIHTI